MARSPGCDGALARGGHRLTCTSIRSQAAPCRIARVFPRRTRATPDDLLAFTDGPGLFPPDVDAVHVSVTFTWDLPRAEHLARQWRDIAPVTIGGPATGMRGEEFVPGMYLRPGYTITSRGCPNKCWFCSVPKREGTLRELPIADGWNLLDDNLLACSGNHVLCVFRMLGRQNHQPEFTGGLEAARFKEWHPVYMRELRTKTMFFAYDEPKDWEPLVEAAELCWRAGFTKASHAVRSYVLCGWPKDTMAAAEARMRQVVSLGVMPMAMPWRDSRGKVSPGWRTFARRWTRPHIVGTELGRVA